MDDQLPVHRLAKSWTERERKADGEEATWFGIGVCVVFLVGCLVALPYMPFP